MTLESDKSSVEVPSIYEGIVESVDVKIGDKVSKGDLLITLSGEKKSEDTSKKTLEEKIPPHTEKIIKEAEDTLVLKEEVKENEKKIKRKVNCNEFSKRNKSWIISLFRDLFRRLN